VVADFAPGFIVEGAFKKRFTELGGTIVGDDRMPISTVDYAPFMERIAQSGADVLMLFVPTGVPSVSFMRALAASGLVKKGLIPIGIGETDEGDLPSFDDSVLGVYSSFYWSPQLPYPATKSFNAAYSKKYGDKIEPPPFTVAAYDGAHLLYQMIKSQQGKPFNGAAAVEAIKGYKWDSPRGPLEIDPATLDIIENMYIRRVEKVQGKKVNVVVDTFPQVKPLFKE
jgi:branched-chain amino acid transport system substrate-binding protein